MTFPVHRSDEATAALRGEAFGRAMATQVRHTVAVYRRMFDERGVTVPDSLPPHEEIDAIAHGADVDPRLLGAVNARTELLNGAAECSVQGAGGLLAQNWDWHPDLSASTVVWIVEHPTGWFATVTEAGMLAKIGLNDRGLGICLNILRSVDDGKEAGLPVHVLLRHLLDCDDVAAATATAKSIAHAASSNVLTADAQGHAASLELSPRGVAVIAPSDGTLAHTNHYLDAELAVHAAPLTPLATTGQRLACAQRHARRAHGGSVATKLGREEIEALLRDESEGAESVCRHPDPSMAPEVRIETVAGVVMDLAARTMWVAPDVPSRTAFHPVRLGAPLPID
jgi:isopenicillin-N N-acyltransferase-like protein